MKRLIRLSALIIVLIFSLNFATFAQDTNIGQEYLQMIQNKYPEESFYKSLTLDDVIVSDYGNFRGGEIIYVIIKGMQYSDCMDRLEIAGYFITFHSGGSEERFLYFKDGVFMTVNEAYKTNLLTQEDIRNIAINQGSLKEVPFTDVPKDAWYYDAAELMHNRGLFTGTSFDTFAPDTQMTRAMLVTVLWRLELSGVIISVPPNTDESRFCDVAPGKWYTEAIIWADYYKIILGTDENHFCPEDIVTREQLATILYRYAAFKGADTSERADISIFPDAASVHTYADDAMSWVVAKKIIQGTNTGSKVILDPLAGATRAQVSLMLMRYVSY